MASQLEAVRQARREFYQDLLTQLQAEPESPYIRNRIESVRAMLEQCQESDADDEVANDN